MKAFGSRLACGCLGALVATSLEMVPGLWMFMTVVFIAITIAMLAIGIVFQPVAVAPAGV